MGIESKEHDFRILGLEVALEDIQPLSMGRQRSYYVVDFVALLRKVVENENSIVFMVCDFIVSHILQKIL